jgi:hypothetical protein
MSTTPPVIKDKTLATKEALFGFRKYVVNGLVQIPAAESRDFNAAEILGADAAKYDMDRLEVQVMVLDNEVGSLTTNFYIEASAVCVVGMTDTGLVRVVNTHTDQLIYWVRIIANLKTA